MRRAIAAEKGDGARWDLKYAAGGLVDLEFIAQYLQLAHAAAAPEILDTATASVFDKAVQEGLLEAEDADVLRPATRLYQDLGSDPALVRCGAFRPQNRGHGPHGASRPGCRRPGFRHA